MWWYPRWTGKRAHPLPSSRHKLRGCNERFCSFYVLESLKRKFILTTSLCQQQLFWKVWQNLKKKIVSCLHYGRSEKQAYRSVNNLVNPCNGQRGCSSELRYRASYTKEKEAWMKFLPLAYSFRDIFELTQQLEVDWLLLAQSVCDTIESLCEYLMTYSSLMVDMFLKRTRGYSLQWPIRGSSAQKENLI